MEEPIRPRPFRAMPLPPSVRIPRWLALALGGALSAGLPVALAPSTPRRTRAVRGLLWSTALSWALLTALDAAEHFRLEKAVTGRWLRFVAVPPSESLLHAAILATNLSALALARPPRSRRGGRARRTFRAIGPAVFLALGWLDELVYHRRRAPTARRSSTPPSTSPRG